MDERRDWGAIGAGFLVFLLALYMIWQFGRAFGRGIAPGFGCCLSAVFSYLFL